MDNERAVNAPNDDPGVVANDAHGLPAQLSAAIVWQALEQAPDAMIVCDGAGVIRHANLTAESMFGYRRAELLGQTIEKLVPKHLQSAHVADRNRFLGEPASRPMGAGLALSALHRDGHDIPVEISLAPVVGESQAFVVAVIRDVTDRLAAAEALSEAHARIAVADEHDRIARDLHDTVIQRLFATGLALQGAAERSDVRERIDRAVSGIDDAIRDLRTSIFTLRQPTLDLGVSDSIRKTAEEARRILDCPLLVDISPEVDRMVPATLRGDLVAVVRESLTNAAKHALARTVALTVDVEDRQVTLHIKDDGVGFTEESINSGQGLRNLRERAESLGGRCEVASVPGNGTRITWTLPLPGGS